MSHRYMEFLKVSKVKYDIMHASLFTCVSEGSGVILVKGSANARMRYNASHSLIGPSDTQNIVWGFYYYL